MWLQHYIWLLLLSWVSLIFYDELKRILLTDFVLKIRNQSRYSMITPLVSLQMGDLWRNWIHPVTLYQLKGLPNLYMTFKVHVHVTSTVVCSKYSKYSVDFTNLVNVYKNPSRQVTYHVTYKSGNISKRWMWNSLHNMQVVIFQLCDFIPKIHKTSIFTRVWVLLITISTQILRVVWNKKAARLSQVLLTGSLYMLFILNEYSCWRLVSLAVECLIYCTIHIKWKYRTLIWIDCNRYYDRMYTWWNHQMETFSALLTFVRGIHRLPVTDEFPLQRPVTRGFDWSAPQQTVEQSIEMPVIWDVIAHYDVMQKVNVSDVVDLAASCYRMSYVKFSKMVLILWWGSVPSFLHDILTGIYFLYYEH